MNELKDQLGKSNQFEVGVILCAPSAELEEETNERKQVSDQLNTEEKVETEQKEVSIKLRCHFAMELACTCRSQVHLNGVFAAFPTTSVALKSLYIRVSYRVGGGMESSLQSTT